MGAWDYVDRHLSPRAARRASSWSARPPSASPAVGSATRHKLEQEQLIREALGEPASRPRAEAAPRPGALSAMSIQLKVPSLGESITQATIGAWLKKEGEPVQVDEPLVEVESEKATVAIPAPAAGVLRSVLRQSGDTVDGGRGDRRARGGRRPAGAAAAPLGSGPRPGGRSPPRAATARPRSRRRRARRRRRNAPPSPQRRRRAPGDAAASGPAARPRAPRLAVGAAADGRARARRRRGRRAAGRAGRSRKEDVVARARDASARRRRAPAPGPAPRRGRRRRPRASGSCR